MSNELQTWWNELERLSRGLGQIGPDEVCCAGLTTRQCAILRVLVAREGARLLDLAESAGITPSAITRALEKLEARGLVRRVRGAQEDGRAAMVTVTPEGRRVRKQIDKLMLERTRTIFESIPAAKRKAVLEALAFLNQALEKNCCCTFNAPQPSAAEKEH
ncbi:MAG: MarR family winged helix-turn-helix transcriptional regulator [Terriglobales bacterium]